MEKLNREELIDQKIYHPIFGNIGEVNNLVHHQGIRYIIFKERSIDKPPSTSTTLRAIPVQLFYMHKSGELRVNFGPQWITEAPIFTPADLDQNNAQIAAMLTEFYSNNTLWSGRINRP